MSSTSIHAFAILLCSSAAFAQGTAASTLSPANTAQASGTRVVVTPEGAFLRSVDANVVSNSAPHAMQAPGLLWTHTDGGLAWIAQAVAIGNHGSEVLAQYWQNNQRTELFSSFDTNPPTALWSDTSMLGAGDQHVASAESVGTQLAMYTLPGGTTTLNKYHSGSGVPDWSYTFGFATNGGTNCAISRDGQTIVAAASNPSLSSVDIAVFGPGSNVPVSYTTVVLGGTNNGIRGFDLSADGTTLYFSAAGNPVNAYIFDIATTSVVFSTAINASFDSHAISGDGSVFAFGNFNTIKLFEKVAGVYTNTLTHVVSGSNYCAMIDISDDSSTVAYGFTYYNNYQTVRIEALDVASHAVTMTDTVTSTVSSLQNIVAGVAISANGQRFAVGLWGDGTGAVAEARLYSKTQNAPVVTQNLNGSVFGVAISADGQRMVAGSKAVHANTLGSGGELDLIGDTTPFTNFCAGNPLNPTACPCSNFGIVGHGCENSSSTGGALLTAQGAVAPDTVVLTSSGELPHALSIVLQGNVDITNGVVFGDGVRCVGGTLKRLYTKNAVDGTVVAPGAGDPSISAQSAAKGDPISSGTSRSYQVYYRDPQLGFCPAPPGDSWNVSNAVRIDW